MVRWKKNINVVSDGKNTIQDKTIQATIKKFKFLENVEDFVNSKKGLQGSVKHTSMRKFVRESKREKVTWKVIKESLIDAKRFKDKYSFLK